MNIGLICCQVYTSCTAQDFNPRSLCYRGRRLYLPQSARWSWWTFL